MNFIHFVLRFPDATHLKRTVSVIVVRDKYQVRSSPRILNLMVSAVVNATERLHHWIAWMAKQKCVHNLGLSFIFIKANGNLGVLLLDLDLDSLQTLRRGCLMMLMMMVSNRQKSFKCQVAFFS